MDAVDGEEGFSSCEEVSETLARQVTIVPAEQVALHLVDLPIRSARHRRVALQFALEEAVGASLDALHFAICETRKDGKLLVAVIDRDVMQAAIAARPDVPVVAEQFLLPRPVEGTGWTTIRKDDRVLVRATHGTGFAVQIDALEAVWLMAGQPDIVILSGDLPKRFNAKRAAPEDVPSASGLAAFDMRQGHYRPALGLERPVKWLAASVVIAVAGHLGLAIADVRAQTSLADTLGQTASSVLQARFPDVTAEDDPVLVRRQIAAASAPISGSEFLPLMNDISTAWIKDGAKIDVRQLVWSGDDLRLVVEAPDFDALQSAEASLAGSGLSVSSGSATADAGSARAEFLVRR